MPENPERLPTTRGTPSAALETRPACVLIVDDDPEWRLTLKSWLEREGFRTVALARADWLMQAIELHQPDVVVLDVQLPGPLTGLDLIAALGRRWPGLFIVVTTAFGGAPTADAARRLGASVYLDKPFRISALVDAIRRRSIPASGIATRPDRREGDRGTAAS